MKKIEIRYMTEFGSDFDLVDEPKDILTFIEKYPNLKILSIDYQQNDK